MSNLNRREFLKLAGLASMGARRPRASERRHRRTPRSGLRWRFRRGNCRQIPPDVGGQCGCDVGRTERQSYLLHPVHLVVTGQISMGRINIGYSSLVQKHGVNLIQGKAIILTPTGWIVGVETKDGVIDLPYDHLVLDPGIDFMPAAGNWNPQLTPHAWQAGPQTTLLKNQLAAVPNNGTFVMTVPKAP